MNTQEKELGENVTVEDIRATLFEGENIVTDKNTDHGAKSLVGDPFNLK
jgi:hypothetical protein